MHPNRGLLDGLLGVFTVVRLVDTVLENNQYLAGITRFRGYYRMLTPVAATYFVAGPGVALLVVALVGDDHVGFGLICGVIAVALLMLDNWSMSAGGSTESTSRLAREGLAGRRAQ